MLYGFKFGWRISDLLYEQEDVLRPYCALDYAWDEPSLPHRLVLELPGNRKLGVFPLDKVGGPLKAAHDCCWPA